MSRLRYCEYRAQLAGKTIRCDRWSNDPDYRFLAVDFEDSTQVSFRLGLTIDADAELCDFKQQSDQPRR
jgi:hypothetical protein